MLKREFPFRPKSFYRQSQREKVIVASVSLLLICFFFPWIAAAATVYYVSPEGSGTTCSSASPCSLDYGVNRKAVAGDTVLLEDGTYNEAFRVVVSGTSEAAITIEAQNDGKADIDAQYNGVACTLNKIRYVNLKGVICRNSESGSSRVGDVEINDSDHLNVERVSAYDIGPGGTPGNGGFTVYKSSHILLQDCAFMGWSRIPFDINSSNYCTVRRCWARFDDTNGATSEGGHDFVAYGSDNTIFENNIGTASGVWKNGATMKGGYVWANYYNSSADYNKWFGNVMYGLNSGGFYISSSQHNITGNEYHNNVAINDLDDFIQRGGENTLVQNFTGVGSSLNNGWVTDEYVDSGEPYSVAKDCDYRLSGVLRDSVVDKGRDLDLGALHLAGGCAPASATFKDINNTTPHFDTTTYGKGAYLIRPADGRGAEVLYRYVGDILTATPLWPWPMEARICAETGYSVTYENGYPGCPNGGGLWKTLEGVYEEGLIKGRSRMN